MDRFFVAEEAWGRSRALLNPEESHHCVRVMRKSPGDEIEIFDGAGRWARGAITEGNEREVTVLLEEEGKVQRKGPSLFLAIAVTKGKVMDLIIQKAVELGVDRIQPLLTENMAVRLSGKNLEGKQEKWSRVAMAACKQCGQNLVPEVCPAVAFEDAVESRGEGVRFLASLDDRARPLRSEIEELPVKVGSVELFIGPEGDFSPPETERAIGSGVRPVSFGSLVLRVETAVIYGLSVLGYELR
ncbi:MAG: RsmE family RNA methyltransferase [Roseibacillus sp.]|nr:RsmE family RNA methyltransferase [Roseibacillus sp.]